MSQLASFSTASPVYEEVLDNGLRVLIQEVHTAPLASVWCWYRVGSKDEAAGQTGVSHWVEHMNFKGTTNIPRDKIKGIIEQFGGYWNGYTWIDQTTYTETATRDALDRMLFIEAERMANCLYDPVDCESERTVIISELQGGENDPDTRIEQELTAAAFSTHPYGHPTIGWLADLKTISRDDLYRHYRRFYVPNNATLVIVGDVETADAMRRAARHFGHLRPGNVARRRHAAESRQLGERRLALARDGATAYLKLGYHAPSVTDPDFFPMLLLDAVLTGAKGLNLWASFQTPPSQRSARLYRTLVDARLASSVMGELLPTAEPFLYTISVTATEGTPLTHVEEAVLAEIDRVRSDGVTEADLVRAARQLRARLVFENDSITNIGHQLGYFQTIANWHITETLAGRIDAVTREQVDATAAERLASRNRTVAWLEPSLVEASSDVSIDADARPPAASEQ